MSALPKPAVARPVNSFVKKPTTAVAAAVVGGAKRPAPAEAKSAAPKVARVAAPAVAAVPFEKKERKERWATDDEWYELLDLEKDDLYTKIKFFKEVGAKMIYMGLPDLKNPGKYTKTINIRAHNRVFPNGLKIWAPSGNITTFNMTLGYIVTEEESVFWNGKFIPWLVSQIQQNATFFFAGAKGISLSKKEEGRAKEDILEAMGPGILTAPQPNKKSTEENPLPDYPAQTKLKIKEDPSDELPFLDIYDFERGVAENNYLIYHHPELPIWLSEHKTDGARNLEIHQKTLDELHATYAPGQREQVARLVPWKTVGDCSWQLLGLSPVNANLFMSVNAKTVNCISVPSGNAHGGHRPGVKPSCPFARLDPAAIAAAKAQAEAAGAEDEGQQEEVPAADAPVADEQDQNEAAEVPAAE